MATLPQKFDTRTAPPPRDDFVLITPADYVAIISDSAMKPTKKNDGEYLELTHEIIEDGPFKGRKIWVRLNIVNPSPKAMEIAQRDLSAICAAVGHVGELPDSIALHNKPHVIRVSVEPADASKRRDKDQNEIKAWKALDGVAPTQAAAPAAGGAKAAPWGANRAA